jgi:hypothetical protein
MWTALGRKEISFIQAQIPCSTGDKSVVVHQQEVSFETILLFCIRFVVGRLLSRMKAPFGVGRKPGQVRPYVRPVTRLRPLAIMGVRLRVRHQSAQRARVGTKGTSVLPELSLTTAFPITLFSVSSRISQACT